MADIKIAGHSFPKWVVITTALGGTAVIGFVYWQHKSNSDSSAAAASNSTAGSDAIDPVTGLPYSQDNDIDPATGLTYLAEAQEYGSVSAAESQASTDGYGYGGDDLSDSYGDGYYVGPTTDTGGSAPYTTNAQWAQAAEAGLSDIGYSETDVSNALGRYLANLTVTSAQATIIYDALAEYGNPPTGSYSVRISSGTTPTTSKVTVPNVVGQPQEAAFAILTEAGFKPKGSPVIKGKTLTVDTQSPAAGTSEAKGSTVTLKSTVHVTTSKK